MLENNGYGLSTPVSEQFRCAQLADRGAGYGMEACTIDGNNVLEVYATLNGYAEDIRQNPRPVLVECMTFRMRGHEEASGVKYVPKESLEAWAERDPVRNYEAWLLEQGLLTDAGIEELRGRYKDRDQRGPGSGLRRRQASRLRRRPSWRMCLCRRPLPMSPPTGPDREIRFVDAVSEGLAESMARFDNLVLMGQDVADYGGVFKISEGFVDRFGKNRVRNTPLCESAIVGAGLGLSIRGWKAIVEMQFADFVTCGFNQIVNNLAKVHYRWGQNADVVVRMPTGAGVGAGPFHSQSNEAWFTHVAGLKVVYPATPEDAKGLLAAAIADPNPVLYFEHKALYRSLQGAVPDGYYTTPIGKARVDREGEELAIITYGMGVHWAGPATALDRMPHRSTAPSCTKTHRRTAQPAAHRLGKRHGVEAVVRQGPAKYTGFFDTSSLIPSIYQDALQF